MDEPCCVDYPLMIKVIQDLGSFDYHWLQLHIYERLFIAGECVRCLWISDFVCSTVESTTERDASSVRKIILFSTTIALFIYNAEIFCFAEIFCLAEFSWFEILKIRNFLILGNPGSENFCTWGFWCLEPPRMALARKFQRYLIPWILGNILTMIMVTCQPCRHQGGPHEHLGTTSW